MIPNMKIMIAALILIPALAFAQSFEASPYNFDNSRSNFENSPLNYDNSPLNWQNSPHNALSDRGIYDNSGNRTGYAVPTDNGTVNIFSDDGERIGYVPDSEW